MGIKGSIERAIKYRPLMHELIIRDLKVKYRRSFLGYLWSLLNPLLMMLLMNLIFSNIFSQSIDNFFLYLICGQTLFTFFSESTSMAMTSILESAPLIKKIYVPKFIFPVSRVFSSFVTMGFSLVAILIVMLFTKAPIYWTIFLIVFPVFFLLVFCCGVSMILSGLAVRFRDVMHLWRVVSLGWMYATPIFYSAEALPPDIFRIISLNPLYHYITVFRSLVMYGSIPGFDSWAACVGSALLAFVMGLLVFNKLQKKFILYI